MITRLAIVLVSVCLTNASLTDRLDCDLEVDFTKDQKSCEERGCVWDSEKRSDDIPVCYLDPKKVGYKRVTDVKTTTNGLEVDLQIKDSAKSLLKHSQYIEDLKFEVTYLTDRIVRLKVLDSKNSRYEVPFQKNFPLLQKAIEKTDEKSRHYSLDISQSKDDFSFSVIRTATKTKVFDTSIGGLIYSEELLQFATRLPSRNIYGLGETGHRSLRHNTSIYNTCPIFTHDHSTGDSVNTNYYGAHPFYQVLESDGKSHGVLVLNSNAMDYQTMPEPGIRFRTVGGVIDIFIFLADSPGNVIELYTSLVGNPFLPPFWALGFQLSRWGHPNTQSVKTVIDRNIKENIPLDVMYLDSDYKDKNRDFSLDKVNHGDLPKLIEDTHKVGIRWNFIIDPNCAAYDYPSGKLYPPFTDGYNNEVFVKWDKSIPKDQRFNPSNAPSDKDVMYGKVWSEEPCAYPDFFKNKTTEWWKRSLTYLHTDLGMKFDALWIDMNEPDNLIDWPENQKKYHFSCPQNKYDYPLVKIMPTYGNGVKNLSVLSLCMVTRQGEKDEYLHYDVHSLYGLTEQIASEKVVHQITGKRGFTLSRSTFVSSGHYGAHWLGDNHSLWPHMKYSIIGTLEMNLFGIPFVGADICGFLSNTTPELCKRWSALGAFYPFSRNHNNGGNKDQDPAYWTENGHPEVTTAARNSLRVRYSFLHYFYTLFYHAHVNGQTVARPVFHEYPLDDNTHSIDEQFMLGRSLLVSPFLYEKQTKVEAYLPNDIWYEFWPTIKRVEKTGRVSLADNDLGVPPLHLRGGSVIPMSSNKSLTNTDFVRNSTIDLLVLPSADKTGFGSLFWDDGESVDTIEDNKYNYFSFNLHNNCSLDINVVKSGYESNLKFNSFLIYGTNSDPVSADLDGQPVDSAINKNDHVEIKAKLDLSSKKSGTFTLTWKSTKTNMCNLV